MNGDMSHQHTIIHIDYFRQSRSTAFHLYRPRPISNAEGEAFSKGFCASLRMFSSVLITPLFPDWLDPKHPCLKQPFLTLRLPTALQAKLASNLQLCRQGALAANSSPSHRCGSRSRPSLHPLLPSARTIWLPWPARHSQSHNATFRHLLLLPRGSRSPPKKSIIFSASAFFPLWASDLLDSQLHLPALITKHHDIFELFPVSAPHTPSQWMNSLHFRFIFNISLQHACALPISSSTFGAVQLLSCLLRYCLCHLSTQAQIQHVFPHGPSASGSFACCFG
jgi:hypothetical protein